MKKAVKVNIQGSIFHIDEDGYVMLKDYLDRLDSHYKNKEGGQASFDGIENKIAGIFNERLKTDKQVITKQDVSEAIDIAGMPDDMASGEQTSQGKSQGGKTENTNQTHYHRYQKKLYRNRQNSILAGVCSGLAQYFDLGVGLVRFIMVILFLLHGLGLLVYIILWIAVPEAKTSAQQQQMKGGNTGTAYAAGNSKSEARQTADTAMVSKSSTGFGTFVEELGSLLGLIIKFCVKLVLGIIGFSLIIGGFFVLIAFAGLLFFKTAIFPVHYEFVEGVLDVGLINQFVDPANFSLLATVLFLTIALPLVALIYGGLKLIFQFKGKDKVLGSAIFALWLLSAIILVSLVYVEGKNYRSQKTVYQNQALEDYRGRSLYLEVGEEDDFEKQKYSFDEYKITYDEEEEKIYGIPEIDIEKASGKKYEVILKKRSYGEDSDQARENANNIVYKWERQGSTLHFNPYFALPEDERWRFPSMRIIIKVPEGKSVFISRSMKNYLDDVHNISNTWEENMVDKEWIMTNRGLKEMDWD